MSTPLVTKVDSEVQGRGTRTTDEYEYKKRISEPYPQRGDHGGGDRVSCRSSRRGRHGGYGWEDRHRANFRQEWQMALQNTFHIRDWGCFPWQRIPGRDRRRRLR